MRLLFLLLVPVFGFGQFTYHKSLEDILVYKDLALKETNDTIESNQVFLGVKIYEKDKALYIMYNDGKTGYIKYDLKYKDVSKEEYKTEKQAYINAREEKKQNEEKLKILAIENRKKVILDSIKILENRFKKNIPTNKITLFYTDVNNDATFPGVSISFYSSFTKDLKYIEFICQGFNRVGDPETEKKTLKLIGPIPANDLNRHDFKNVFYSSILDDVKVSKIIVTKFDNTKVTLLPTDFTLKENSLIRDYQKKLMLEIEYLTISNDL